MLDEDITFFTVEDTAALLMVHPETVRRWCRAGKLPHFRAGRRGRLRIPATALVVVEQQMLLKAVGDTG